MYSLIFNFIAIALFCIFMYYKREWIQLESKEKKSLPDQQREQIKNFDERFGFFYQDKPRSEFTKDFWMMLCLLVYTFVSVIPKSSSLKVLMCILVMMVCQIKVVIRKKTRRRLVVADSDRVLQLCFFIITIWQFVNLYYIKYNLNGQLLDQDANEIVVTNNVLYYILLVVTFSGQILANYEGYVAILIFTFSWKNKLCFNIISCCRYNTKEKRHKFKHDYTGHAHAEKPKVEMVIQHEDPDEEDLTDFLKILQDVIKQGSHGHAHEVHFSPNVEKQNAIQKAITKIKLIEKNMAINKKSQEQKIEEINQKIELVKNE